MRAIVFDLDYTLYDAADFLRSAYRAMARDLARRHRRDPEQLFQLLCGTWQRLTCRDARVIGEFLGAAGLPAHEEPAMVRLLNEHQTELTLYEDAKSLIASLSPRVQFGIVTDGHPMMQRNKVNALGLVDRFASIIFTADGGDSWRKPSPLPFLAVLAELRVRPEDAVYIGDNPQVDGAGAKRAGMCALRLRRGEFTAEHADPVNFDGEIDSLQEVRQRYFAEVATTR